MNYNTNEKKPASSFQDKTDPKAEDQFSIQVPSINLPKGGGALKSIDEQFEVNAMNGTASYHVPLPISPTRNDFAPGLSLTYNSGAGNSCFGLGWVLSLPAIQRKTDKQLPQYRDADESDTFMFTGSEDLVPALKKDISGNWVPDETTSAKGEKVKRYRPRIESSFNRIERITLPNNTSFYWKVTTAKNVVTFYGRSAATCISNPGNPDHIFKWLPELSYDDTGNCFEYEYVAEDLQQVTPVLHEQNRLNGNALFANCYLRSVHYGNTQPFSIVPADAYNPPDPVNPQYVFEIVFDFGDHTTDNPIPAIQQPWPARNDAFSDYHAGFDVRTYRLCRRILFFHYFKELGDGINAAPVLVRSLDLIFRYANNPAVTAQEKRNAETDYTISITNTGYIKKGAGYTKKSLPPVQFRYQELKWNTAVNNVDAENLANAPVGIGNNYQWLDLWDEGISGILTEQAGGWYYKSNLGNATFSRAEPVIPKPSLQGLASNSLQLQDLEGDGRKFIVCLKGPAKGYFEIDGDNESWQPFESFNQVANVDTTDSNCRFIDLNGDGRPDIIISEENIFTWYGSQGMIGYGNPAITAKAYDEEKGPAITFRDPEKSIFLADMTGDGMTDIVRVRNGEVCYWPNLGYGRFGAKVNMGEAPVFDAPDQFNPAYLHLADVSGTGATDILYLGKNRCRAWINLSGNAWSEPVDIDFFPGTELPGEITVTDFLGNGTACIVWSSPLPGYANAPLRYIDLMGGNKPYIISSYSNNLGKVVTCTYKSSTYYYLQDKLAGTPWITRLPFPVHCVQKLETDDLASGMHFSSTYSYHHGYYDHPEKEFRGFGRVEQTDSEDFTHFVLSGASNVVEQDLHQPPVKIITWFHTGAYIKEEKILGQFETEYFKGPFEFDLPEPVLPAGLTAIEIREAYRACKGMALRKEVYALDGSLLQSIPYTVDKHNCLVKLLQPRLQNQYAAFLNHESEAATFYAERNVNDPRIAHSLNLVVDDFGNVLQSTSVVYGRKTTDLALPADIQQQQSNIHITYTVNSITNNFDIAATYRLPLPAETMTFELTGVNPANGHSFTIAELMADFTAANLIKYEDKANNVSIQKRLIEDIRVIYLQNDLITPLLLGNMDTLALVQQHYKLAFTPSLLTNLFGSIAITNPMLITANYVQADGINWWMPSGTKVYLQGVETVADAQKRFYLPVAVKDPFNNATKLTYDTYLLALVQVQDALLNITRVDLMDYRLLKPNRTKDMNDNTSEVLFDELGMVIVSSEYGTEGDGMHGDQPLSSYVLTAPVNLDEVMTNPLKFLQQATTFFYYDLDAWMNTSTPIFFASVARETYTSDLLGGAKTRTFLSVGYSGGLGHELQTKSQADPGDALQWVAGVLTTVDTTPNLRWIGSGRTIYNNKGNPVIQYEPFFSTSFHYEPEDALVEIGFSSIRYYDALGRNYRVEHPNATLTRVEFDAWKQLAWDENDTVLESGWYTALGSPNPLGPEPANPDQRAAWLAAKQAKTPEESHLDSLGRSIYHIANNGADGSYATRDVFDIENNRLAVIDDRSNTVMSFDYDMASRKAHQHGMDNGDKWTFLDVMNMAAQEFTNNTDNNNQPVSYAFRHDYDALHRPIALWLTTTTGAGTTLKMIGQAIYGEGQVSDTTLNLRGKLFQQYDTAGLLQVKEYDFKGNQKDSFRQLAIDYKNMPDWNILNKNSLLELESFENKLAFNAVNKPTLLQMPEGSKIMPIYNDTGLLDQLNVFISSQALTQQFVSHIEYDAKGQRQRILFGNNTVTGYTYEPTTYRLTRLLTTRNGGADILQDLDYTYDPVSNITQVIDNAQQTIFFNNAKVDPSNKFEYDAIYRLVHAWGREFAGQNAASDQFDADKSKDGGGNRLVLPGDMNAMQNYEELYQYDHVGNLLHLVHNAGNGGFSNKWTRDFTYNNSNNRLIKTQVGATSVSYDYDLHGNMLALQTGSFGLHYDCFDRLSQTDIGGGNTAYYVYDAKGARVRKVIENGNLIKERIYLGMYELYREVQANVIQLERQTLHVMDNNRRVALIETRSVGNDKGLPFLIRYQYSNHIGSACLELGQDAALISYEEYYPFGSTAYQAMDNSTETDKRYRFTGKERDEESGLYYHGARYYAPWLVRWIGADPMGTEAGVNLYVYVKDNPVKLVDPSGTDDKQWNVTTGPDGMPVYQSTGDQALKDLGTIAKGVGAELLKSDEVKALKKKFIDPQLDKAGQDLEKDWEKSKVTVILAGATVVLPAAVALTALAIENKSINVPIVGDTTTGQLVGALGGLGLKAATEGLTHDHLSVNFGYEKKNGADVFSFELKITTGDTSKKPEDSAKKPGAAGSGQGTTTTTGNAPAGLPDKAAVSATQKPGGSSPAANNNTVLTISGKAGGGGGEGQVKLEKPTDIGKLTAGFGFKVDPTQGKSYTVNLGLDTKIAGARVLFQGQGFVNAQPGNASPLVSPKIDDKTKIFTGPLPIFVPQGTGVFFSATVAIPGT